MAFDAKPSLNRNMILRCGDGGETNVFYDG